jgi:hypothetical protein
MCTNCHKVFDGSKKYCSERCARDVRRHRRQIFLGSVLGALVLAFAIYTAPRGDLRPEPRWPMSAFGFRNSHMMNPARSVPAKRRLTAKFVSTEKFSIWARARRAAVVPGMGGLFALPAKAVASLEMQWQRQKHELKASSDRNHEIPEKHFSLASL